MVIRNQAALPPLTLARWLAWPMAFVMCQWLMLFKPHEFTTRVPSLWETGGKGLVDVLPPTPKTRVQIFQLGWHWRHYSENCLSDSTCFEWSTTIKEQCAQTTKDQCAQTLQAAAEVVGLTKPLTEKQLLGMKDYLAELDAQKSVTDRVMGFFSFMNIIWLLAVLGITLTVVPCIAYLVGPVLLKVAQALKEKVLKPLAIFLHNWGFFEAVAYLISFTLAVQGLQYPAVQAEAGLMVGLTGGMFMAPCWFYSTTLHIKTSGGNENKFMMLTNGLLALALAPIAISHDSKLIGFIAVLAVYGAMGFMFCAFGFGFLIGFEGRVAAVRCLASSVLLVVLFTGLRIAGVESSYLRPFSTGAMCLGNVMFFLAMLILSNTWRVNKWYVAINAAMLGTLLLAMLIGNVYALPSMSNTATVFFVLWVMEKELEVRWGGFGIVVLFLNFVALYFIAHYLHTHPDLVMSVFDPQGLYV